MSRRLATVAIAAAFLASCAPKPGAVVDQPKTPALERLPADAVLWEGAMPDGVDSTTLLEKDGVLTKNAEPAEDAARWWPYAIDYWALARTDLDTLLAPHVGRSIRVRGHYKKIYDHGTWIYEVEPVRITALADASAR